MFLEGWLGLHTARDEQRWGPVLRCTLKAYPGA